MKESFQNKSDNLIFDGASKPKNKHTKSNLEFHCLGDIDISKRRTTTKAIEINEAELKEVAPPPPLQESDNTGNAKAFWVPNRSAKQWYKWYKDFGFFRRRHHWRVWGNVFWSNEIRF